MSKSRSSVNQRQAEDGVEAHLIRLGLQLHAAREKAGMTQLEVASLAGTTQSYLSRIEGGKYFNRSVILLLKLGKVNGMKLELRFVEVK